MINKKLLLIAFFMRGLSLYGMEADREVIDIIKDPLLKILEYRYNLYSKSLKVLNEESEGQFDNNKNIVKDYLVKLGYDENGENVKKVLQKNSDADSEHKITLKARIKLFEALDHEATEIRTGLVFRDFAKKLTTLLQSKQFAPVAVPSFHEISSDPNATIKWVEGTKKLIDFIIADWQLIQNREITFNNNDLNDLLGINNDELGDIVRLIFPLKNMQFAEFNARIDSPEKRKELLDLLEKIAGYLDWFKTEFGKREKEVNTQLYGRDKNSKFTEGYNKKASIKTMHDYLNTVLVSSKKYTKAIDFILKKFGRLTPRECIDGTDSYIKKVKPIREVGELLSVIGLLLNTGLSLRGHTLNGMKQSGLELGVYLKNKELRLAAKYVGASFHKKHLFGLLLPAGIAVAVYGHYKTDTLRQKRDKFKAVITELEKPYQRQAV